LTGPDKPAFVVGHIRSSSTPPTKIRADKAGYKGKTNRKNKPISSHSLELYIADPDCVKKLETGAPLNQPNRATLYGGNERGYTDYPSVA
jgi:hypothetical protein